MRAIDVVSQLKVSDGDISSGLEHYDAFRQMLGTHGCGAPMSDEHGGSTLSLAEIHVLREAGRILKHNYS